MDSVRARRRRIGGLGTALALALAAIVATCGPVRAENALEWESGFRVVHDEAGRLRVEAGDRIPLVLSLQWFDATSSRALELTRAAGLEPRTRDGSSHARLPATPARLEVRRLHWGYFHVDPIVFLDASLRADEGTTLEGAPGVALETEGPWSVRRIRIRPHVAVGRANPVEVEVLETVVDLGPYERRYLGVVRLERRRGAVQEDGRGIVWEAGTGAAWRLALVGATSRSSLAVHVGQALLTYDGAGRLAEPRWKVPPMCGRCRSPRLEELRLQIELRDRAVHVLADLRSDEALHPVAWAALRLEDVPMNHFHRGRVEGRTLYEIPVSTAVALTIAEAVETGSLDAEVVMDAGTIHRPDATFVMATPYLAESVRAAAPADLGEELPSYLSPRLVANRPNPFRDATTIEVIVPSTLDEAFDLEPDLRARLDPSTPPPFGAAPTVRVKVYNVSGQLVDVLDERPREPGRFAVHWDGTDVQGRPVAAGAYYVNVEMNEWSVTKRVLRIRN